MGYVWRLWSLRKGILVEEKINIRCEMRVWRGFEVCDELSVEKMFWE